MKTTLLLAVFVAIISQFMADEAKAWSGWLHKKIRRRAVAKLPAECRDRYDEEWESGVEEVPGDIFKIFYSIGLLWAAFGIRKAAPKGAVNSENASALFKRTFDIVFSGLLLILFAPLLLMIAIAVKLDSRGPALYKSKRLGKKGSEFFCLKFRTMGLDADERCADLMHINDPDSVSFKVGCPKITRIGRFLRKYSLDELPQFFNVLRGEMSIVGPRPPITRDVLESELGDLRRLDVVPGLTGLWQLQSGKYPSLFNFLSLNETYAETYADNRSLWLDFKIILRTILVVFTGTGS
jgi:lipopolysaccharide/colanic/teichoic acid biosynthesis glycosyltransferase